MIILLKENNHLKENGSTMVIKPIIKQAKSPRMQIDGNDRQYGKITASSTMTTTTTTAATSIAASSSMTTKKNIGNLFNNVEDITRAINNLNDLVNSMGNGGKGNLMVEGDYQQ